MSDTLTYPPALIVALDTVMDALSPDEGRTLETQVMDALYAYHSSRDAAVLLEIAASHPGLLAAVHTLGALAA